MRRRVRGAGLAAISTLVFGLCISPADAHHSVASFDFFKSMQIDGTVTQVEWTNPHSYVHLMTRGKTGGTDQFVVEIGVPNGLVRDGWRKDSVKIGDKVRVAYAPRKDNKPEGALQTMTLPNGTTLKGFAAAFLQ